MDEYIFPRLTLDEPITLAGIKPLYCSLLFHCHYLTTIKLFVPLKRTADLLCLWATRHLTPLDGSKRVTRAANARLFYQKRLFIVQIEPISNSMPCNAYGYYLTLLFSVRCVTFREWGLHPELRAKLSHFCTLQSCYQSWAFRMGRNWRNLLPTLSPWELKRHDHAPPIPDRIPRPFPPARP